MAGVFVPPGKQRFEDPNSGAALAGGLVYMTIPGTGTAKDSWQDEALTILNTNPIILDGNGQCTIWGNGLYRQRITDAGGSPIWDQVTGFIGGGATVTFATPSQVAALSDPTVVISPYALGASGVLGAGGGGYGATKPLSTFGVLSLDGVTVGNNDTILTAAEADATSSRFYGPAGTIRTNLTKDQLTKGYEGDAAFVTGPGAGDGAFRPPRYSYMSVKPSTWPVQGEAGFWQGDQRFTDGGEWKIIGPNVRTYDITSRYFESNTIPHASWLDVNSGGSGIDAFLTSGAAAGASTITINGPATLGWVGKTVAFSLTADGAVAESHAVTEVSGSTFSIAPATLSNTYTWNPGASQTPCIFFGHRTWAGMGYVKIRHAGAGDSYGDIVRQNLNYAPLGSQYHSFMASTGGQYGGDVYFNNDGIYGQFFESQLQGQTYDVTAIGFVGSFVRNVDTALDGGKFWAGNWYQSGGTRPIDAGMVLLGPWRNGLDTVFATMEETSRLTANAGAGTAVLTVASVNGARPNDTLIIGSETKIIQSVNTGAKQITLTTNLVGSYTTGQLVLYPLGGAVLNMARGQRIVFGSSLSANARAGDPLGVFPSLYGNVQGTMFLDSGTVGGADYLALRMARGTSAAAPDTARVRLKDDGAGTGIVQIFGTGTHTIAGLALGFASGCNINMALNNNINWGACYIYSDGAHIYATNNGGGSFVTIV